MQKVIFTYRTGRERLVSQRDAELLSRLRQGTYRTRDLIADTSVLPLPSASITPPIAPPIQPASDGLDELGAEALHKLAKERGVEVHHRAGSDKVRAALRETRA